MKKLLFALLFLVGCAHDSTNKPELLEPSAPSDTIFYEKAIEQKDKNVLVVFGAEWCAYCVKLKNDLKSADLNGLVVCVVDVEEREDLKNRYKIKSLPTVLMIKNKKEISRMEGYDKNKFNQFLKKYIENYSSYEMKLLENHNKERISRGYAPLQIDKKLCEYAQSHAEKMAKKGTLEHSQMTELEKVAHSNLVGENIAWGQKNEEEVVISWMWSPGHRWNILGSNYKRVGFGMKKDNNERTYWCVVFSK